MAIEARIDFSTTSSATGPLTTSGNTYLRVAEADGAVVGTLYSNIPDITGASTPFSFVNKQGTADGGFNTPAASGSGDANWAVDILDTYWLESDPAERIYGWGNLDPLKLYTVEMAPSSALAGPRETDYTVDSVTKTVDAAGNVSNTAKFIDISPDVNNEILVTQSLGTNAASSSHYVNAARIIEQDAAAASPTITDINTNNEVVPGATNTLNGTNLSLAGGSITIGAVLQTINTRLALSIEFTGVRGGNPYNKDLTLTYTDALSNTTTQTVQQVPESGTFAVTAASPNTTDDASLWTGLIDTATSDPITIVDGDQAWVKNPNNLTNLAIQPDGTITADETGDFVVQIWLASEGVWGSDQTVSFTLPDTVAPTVSSVSVPTAGSYKAGDALSFTVNFSETVSVSGTPQLALNIGGTTRQADYASGTGTSALVFSYTVQAGDNDADGIAVGTLAMNGGTIQDAATNAANLTLNSVGVTSGVLVDTVKPVITPIGANPATVVQGETYTDAGATASDDQDGSLGSVTGTGTVDTNTIGQYTITYPGAGVVDSAGNVAEDATRVVNVVAESVTPDIELKKKQNDRRRYAANCYGAWRNRFRSGN